MNWIRYMMYALGLTCLTGSMWTVIWCVAYVFLKRKGNIRWVYQLLKFAMAGYIVPVLFLFLMVHYWLPNNITGYLFAVPSAMETMVSGVFQIWLAGVAICSLIYISKLSEFLRICRTSMPVSLECQEVAKRLCNELKLSTKVEIRQGYSVAVPFVCGFKNPRIYLPVYEYDRKEQEIILMHELIHFKKQDVFWKPVFVIVCCIYWFNPLVWFVARQFQKWSEVNCDMECCERRYRIKTYFMTIWDMMDLMPRQTNAFVPTWQNGKNELKWRIQMMKKYQWKKQKKWVTAIATTGVLLMSTVCTFGAEIGTRHIYTSFYTETATVVEEETAQTEELPGYTSEEQIGTLADFEGMEVIAEDRELLARSGIIDFTVNNKVVKQTPLIKKSVGDTIEVSVMIDPSDKVVRVGILEPDGRLRYVTGSGTIVHTFTVEQDGYHRVYVYNNSGVSVHVYGSYR